MHVLRELARVDVYLQRQRADIGIGKTSFEVFKGVAVEILGIDIERFVKAPIRTQNDKQI